MSATHRLMFAGQSLPGIDSAQMRTTFTERLKLTPEQADLIFSGKVVSIKKFTSYREAEAFMNRLADFGAKTWVEVIERPQPPANPVPHLPQQAAPQAPASQQAPAQTPEASTLGLVPMVAAAEEMECPSCGELQPKRTLCRKCSADMPRVLAAREEAKREATQQPRPEATDSRPTAFANAVARQQLAIDTPSLIGFGIGGRIGRVTYLMGSLAISAMIIPIAILGLKMNSLAIMAVLLILAAIFGLRLSILRCHDLGWNAWLAAVQLIPYVGGLFSLILLVVPGNRGENEHGDPTPIAGGGLLAACVVIAVGSSISIRNDAGSMVMALAAMQGKGKPAPQPARTLQAESAPPVILYTDGGCSQCALRRQELASAGIAFQEISLDDFPAVRTQLRDALAASGMDGSHIPTPMLQVNGMLLPEGVSVADLQAFLRSPRQ
ncbi:MAG TPA: DUF805 domain-containing protein [Rhodocyclaceae bacterium]|nr:DUF805 domain-containing protein [Rhodocyclaceae bacterium]